ncbi:hypothetical protein IAD21_03858 [Abditibacteriota bacterium]|nr:hypothetical protein IAD21_03858 [Abditibacteriota bacterium]
MKKSEAEARTNAVNFIGHSSTFMFVVALVVVIAQWVCLLAVLEPRLWIPWAHIARWIYAAPLVVYLMAVIPGKENESKSPSPQRPALIWLLLGALCNVAVIAALFNERFDVALFCGFGWNALSAVRNWLFSDNKSHQQDAEKLESYRREYEHFQRLNGIFYPLFFVILVVTIALCSLPLCILLFLAVIALQSVSFLRMKQEAARFALARE